MAAEHPSDTLRPFVGVEPFPVEHAPFFFGRQRESRDIISMLGVARLTVLYGESGVGKSSILNAGVVHQLRQMAERNLRERGIPEVAVAVFRSWVGDPLTGLKDAIDEAVRSAWREGKPTLVDRSLSLVEFLEEQARNVGGELFVILDQFEEYLRYHESGDDPGSFFAEFAEAVGQPQLAVSFVIAMRKDALVDLDQLRSRIPQPFTNRIEIRNLDRRSGEEAIRRPLQAYAEITGEKFAIDDALVAEILKAAAECQVGPKEAEPDGRSAAQPASGDSIATPLLQLILEKLWDADATQKSRRLTLKTYREVVKNPNQLLERHVADRLNRLASRQRVVATKLLNWMVKPSGAKIAVDADDLANWTHQRPSVVRATLMKLRDPLRLLRLVSADRHTFELLHDVFGLPIRSWLAVRRRRVIQRRAVAWAAAALIVLVIGGYFFFQASKATSLERWVAKLEVANSDLHEANLQLEMSRAESDDRYRQLAIAQTLALAERFAATARSELGGAAGNLRAGVLAVESLRHADSLSGREALRKAMEGTGKRLLVEQWQDPPIQAAAVSPSGELIAFATAGGCITILKARTGETLATIPCGEPTPDLLAITADETLLAAASDQTLRIWSVQTASQMHGHTGIQSSSMLIASLETPRPLIDLGFSPAGNALACLDRACEPYVLDPRSTNWLESESSTDRYWMMSGGLTFDPTGEILRWYCYDSYVAQGFERPAAGGTEMLFDMGSQPGEQPIDLLGDSTGRLRTILYDNWHARLKVMEEGYEIIEFYEPDARYACLGDSGDLLAIVGGHDQVYVVDLDGPAPNGLEIPWSGEDQVSGAALSDSGRTLVVWSENSIAAWEITCGLDRLQTRMPGASPTLGVSSQGQALLSRAYATGRLPDGVRIDLRILGSGEVLWWRNLSDLPSSLATNPECTMLATLTGNRIDCLDPSADAPVGSIHIQSPSGVLAVQGGSASGKTAQIAAGTLTQSRSVVILDVTSGNTIELRHPRYVIAAVFVPRCEQIATACIDGELRLWNVNSGATTALWSLGERALSLGVSIDGELVIAGGDSMARIWQIDEGRPPREIQSVYHGARIGAVAVSGDGRRAATGGIDGAVCVWNLMTGEMEDRILHSSQASADRVVALEFPSEENTLAVLYASGLTRIVQLGRNDLIADACSQLARDLTGAEWEQLFPDLDHRCTCAPAPSIDDEVPTGPWE